MCTVTFIPQGNRYLLCSSRDEQHTRLPAILPSIYQVGGMPVLYPRDSNAGGSWFALNGEGNLVVFLNGAWKKHIHNPPYLRSRGLILLDLIGAASPLEAFDQLDLAGIESFTAIIMDKGRLFDCRWDGSLKSTKETDAASPQIWSSVTLYDAAAVEKRTQWFREWLQQHPAPEMDEILQFHQRAGDGDQLNDIRMNRETVYTISITGADVSPSGVLMQYLDLASGQSYFNRLSFSKPMPASR
jgi:Transport and Golgi organisation 2